jgi:hypothetical protein
VTHDRLDDQLRNQEDESEWAPSGCLGSAPSTASAPHLIVHIPERAWRREEAPDRREAGAPSPCPVFGGRGRENDSSSCPV